MKRIPLILCITLLLFSFSFADSTSSKYVAMAPLYVNFNDSSQTAITVGNTSQSNYSVDNFKQDLASLKAIGVTAISVDVWWNAVEPTEGTYNWQNYDAEFQAIADAGLNIVANLNFHSCGGNVGDSFTSPLPSWIWQDLDGKTVNLGTGSTNTKEFNYSSTYTLNKSNGDLNYMATNGYKDDEYIALWDDSAVLPYYSDFMKNFADTFSKKSYADKFVGIAVSCGPAGELRYPSYNGSNNYSYPSAGDFQSSSPIAKYAFKQAILSKYKDISGINSAWNTSFPDDSGISSPSDANSFFNISNSYTTTQYGIDYINWYNDCLAEHGYNMIKTAQSAIGSSFQNANIAFKIPGVHWQMANPSAPRSAEVAAGLIAFPNTTSSIDYSDTSYYTHILQTVASAYSGKPLLYFTCLEMNNSSDTTYSNAQSLVRNFATTASNLGYTVEGENALNSDQNSMNSYSSDFWQNILYALKSSGYSGINILRMNNVSSGDALNAYKSLISAT